MTTYATDLKTALALADVADAITLDRYHATNLIVETKPDMTPVSDADKATEAALRKEIASKLPEDNILGEEYGGAAAKTGRQWILDPIDGTANFVRNVPVWATLIGLAIDGAPKIGVVSAPALGRRWYTDGETAWVSAFGKVRELEVSKVSDLAHASVSLNGMHYWDEAGYRDAFTRLSLESWRDRAYGEFWSYMLLAEGALDITGECGLYPYDLAALLPIVRAAGGTITNFSGTETIWDHNVIATNGLLQAAALDIVNTAETN